MTTTRVSAARSCACIIAGDHVIELQQYLLEKYLALMVNE
jgi:hypothetical protein